MSQSLSTGHLPDAQNDVRPVGLQRGTIGLKIAETAAEQEACQALRYKVFYEDGGASANAQALANKLDADGYDDICDHLLVTDGEHAVGTYRLLRQDRLGPGQDFYSQGEFDLAPLLAAKPDLRFLELGRSCVLAEYRTKRIIELLWQGIWDYVRAHQLDVMIGCASLGGTDTSQLSHQLSYLHHHHLAPEDWRVVAHPEHCASMDKVAAGELDAKRALKAIPPLVKGYLRLGGYVGEGAVIDYQFNTTDVLIILPVSAINPRYFARFGAPGEPR
ncbi:MAG: GNAT family N-acetyltransferase [Alphaproteobacteria bacterium]|nr:GNAT family N-acetyltransferase [Alphaproteobacteria bacterium]